MQAPLIGIEDDSRDHKTQQQSPDHTCQRPRRSAAKPHHMDAGHTVSDAVAKGSHQQHLFCGKDGKSSP